MHSLDEANSKLSAARLGESLERNQQSERLLILDQPVVPNAPAKPNRPKLYLLSFHSGPRRRFWDGHGD